MVGVRVQLTPNRASEAFFLLAPRMVMKKRLLQMLVISWVFFDTSVAHAQSNYEPYWFATLDGLAGTYGHADGIGRAARLAIQRALLWIAQGMSMWRTGKITGLGK